MLSGGGTGGHVYPLLAVAEALERDDKAADLLYVGSSGGVEEGLVAGKGPALSAVEGIPFRAVAAGQLRGKAPWTVVSSVLRLIRGAGQARRLMREFAPDVALVTGGYASVPVVVAAWLQKVPVVIYLPDLEPGLAIRVLSRFAQRVAVTFEEVRRYFPPGKAVVTGYPVRAEFLAADRATARQRFGLDAGLRTVTIFGGSRGAHSINVATAQALPALLAHGQVIHISGQRDAEVMQRAREALPAPQRERYKLYPYLHQGMAEALAAADVVVARAGASTLGEFPAVGVPGVLVPYPHAGQHQQRNADYLAQRGAAVIVDDAALSDQLRPTILRLLDDEATLREMARRARSLAQPDAAAQIVGVLRGLNHGYI